MLEHYKPSPFVKITIKLINSFILWSNKKILLNLVCNEYTSSSFDHVKAIDLKFQNNYSFISWEALRFNICIKKILVLKVIFKPKLDAVVIYKKNKLR